MCLSCHPLERTRLMREGYCPYCHPLQETLRGWFGHEGFSEEHPDDPDALAVVRCPKCNATWAAKMFCK